MTTINITSLHQGMNLRDPAALVLPGETGISVGMDFGVPGQISPLSVDALVQTFPTGTPAIQWAVKISIQGVYYLFTTHSDGLRVTTGNTVTLIDASFTGTFKALPINDQYVVTSNATLVKKWRPGWTSTDQWGVNTAPVPTLALGALISELIDGFESLSGWTATGGTATLDTVNFQSGSGSINLAAAANGVVKLTKVEALNLSCFVTPGDLGTGFISVWFLATNLSDITSLHLLFDCSATANFKTDWYQADITINNVATTTLTYAAGGTVPVPSGFTPIPTTASGEVPTDAYDASSQQIAIFGIPASSTKKQEVVKYKTYGFSDAPVEMDQVLVLKKGKRQTTATSGIWMQFQFQMSEFTRYGTNENYDWSTITAIQVKFDCGPNAGSVNVDSLDLVGGGFPFGDYYFAVAYENEFGNYGPYSQFAGPVEANGQEIVLSGLTPDTDLTTTQRRVAVIGGSMTDPMVFWIDDNTSTSYTYNLPDTALSTIETNFNEDPPPPFTDMVQAFDQVFGVSGDALYYSDIGFYEGFPASNIISFPTETLNQVAVLPNQYIAVRGDGENLVQVLSSDPTTWAVMSGAREGAASSQFMIDIGGGQQVWAAKKYFWQSADSEYLPKIGWAVSDFAQIFGAQAGDLAYLWYTDKSGIPWVLRIDYRLGYPLGHYVGSLTPSCIFSDPIEEVVFYSLGTSIYQFCGGTGPAATSISIPEQFDKSSKIKDFSSINYDLQNGPIGMYVVRERNVIGTGFGLGLFGGGIYGVGGYSLPTSAIDGNPVSLPPGACVSQGYVLGSSANTNPNLLVDQNGNNLVDQNGNMAGDQGQGFILTLPVKVNYADVGD